MYPAEWKTPPRCHTRCHIHLADLLQNAQAFISSVIKAKPAGAKGVYLKKVHMSSTMGPSLKVDLSTISN